MSSHSPPPDIGPQATALERVNEICEAFELGLRAGESPLIEDYLNRARETDRRPLLLELLLLELTYREPKSPENVKEEYLARFPDHSQTIERALSRVFPSQVVPPTSARRAEPSPAPSPPLAVTEDVLQTCPPDVSSDDQEVRELLRRRLWIASAVAATALTAELLKIFIGVLFRTSAPLLDAASFAWYVADKSVAVLVVICVAVLARLERNNSLSRLRRLECVLVGSLVSVGLLDQYLLMNVYLHDVATVVAPQFGDFLLLSLADARNIVWACLIIGYGVLIPNTIVRCVVVVSFMAISQFCINLVVGIAEGIPGLLLVRFLSQTAIWMTVVVAITVYGAHRINTLQRQALAGRKLGQYRLIERLGKGGMGEVYLAEHALLRRPCAVKVIHPDRAGDRKTLLRFEREVQATAKLTSPHTVELYDYGHTPDGTFYYVMEYLPGIDLERLVGEHGALPAERVIYFLTQLCTALQEAHAKGLIHRDIKPSNIIICERGGFHDVVKLLDFGLVRAVNAGSDSVQLTEEGLIAGTPAYLSPEQALGQIELDARSDIYSLGAVAYFLLVGRPPFDHRSVMKTVAAHLYEPVQSPRSLVSSVPADLEEVVLRCLTKDPARRYTDIPGLMTELTRCSSARQWSADCARRWWEDKRERNAPRG